MSESLVGLSVAATRQNAGRLLKACVAAGGAAAPPAAGGLNAPALTACARVMVVFGRVSSDARLAHDPDAGSGAGDLATTSVGATTTKIAMMKRFTGRPPESAERSSHRRRREIRRLRAERSSSIRNPCG